MKEFGFVRVLASCSDFSHCDILTNDAGGERMLSEGCVRSRCNSDGDIGACFFFRNGTIFFLIFFFEALTFYFNGFPFPFQCIPFTCICFFFPRNRFFLGW